MICKIRNCKSNNNKNSISGIDPKLRFFVFPKNKELRERWVKICHQEREFNIEAGRVCSDHFLETDYHPKERLLKYPPCKWKLKPDVVPSVNIPFDCENVLNDFELQIKKEEEVRKRHLIIKEVMAEYGKTDGIKIEQNQFQEETIGSSNDRTGNYNDNDFNVVNVKEEVIQETFLNIKATNCDDLIQLESVDGDHNYNTIQKIRQSTTNAKFNATTQTDHINIRAFNKNVKALEEEILDLKSENKSLKRIIQTQQFTLKGATNFFSANQLRKLQYNCMKRVKWSVEDIKNAAPLYAAGPQLYKLLVEKKYPFPSPATLRHWSGKLNLVLSQNPRPRLALKHVDGLKDAGPDHKTYFYTLYKGLK